MESHAEALEYLENLVKGMRDDARIKVYNQYTFLITLSETRLEVQFGLAEIDDLAIALKQYRSTSYFYTLENQLRFRLYIALGSSGLLNDLRISKELAEEKGDWLRKANFDVSFNDDFARILYEGLKALNDAITTTLTEATVEVPELENDAENVRYLIKYYEETGNLSSREVSLESLSYLKGATICFISKLEKERENNKVARIRTALSKKIYSIVTMLRREPFERTPPPECALEFVERQQSVLHRTPTMPNVRDISGDKEEEIDELLNKLDTTFLKRRSGAWETFRSKNPDRLSQASNSMVELLDQVISRVCEGTTFADFLTNKFGNEETKWIEATRKWISETKSNLHRVKHHTDYQSEQITEGLLNSAESIIILILR